MARCQRRKEGCNSRFGLAQIGLGKGKPAIIPGNGLPGYSPGEGKPLVSRAIGSPVCAVRRDTTPHTRGSHGVTLVYVKG